MAIFTLIGTFIGAGFASGQEIYTFFYKYGKCGIIGIGLFGFILGYVIYKVQKLILKYDIKNYKEFLDIIFKNKQILSNINNFFVNLFLCVSFFIMVNGFGAYFNQEYGINRIIGSILIIILSYIIFLKNIECITKINSIIVPSMVIFILIIGIKNIMQIDFNEIKVNIELSKSKFFILQAILYSSYNLILLIPVIINLKNYVKTKNQAKKTALYTAVIITLLTLLAFFLLININKNVKPEMPIVYVIKSKFPQLKNIYGIVILTSIFTTAISSGMSFLNNIVKDKNKMHFFTKLLCLVSIFITKVKFSVLINFMFPIFGYLGLLQIYHIFKTK